MRKRLGAVYLHACVKDAQDVLTCLKPNGRIRGFLGRRVLWFFSKQWSRHSCFSAFQCTQLITKLRADQVACTGSEWYLQALNTANYDIEMHTASHSMQLREGPHGPLPAVKTLYLGAVGAVPLG